MCVSGGLVERRKVRYLEAVAATVGVGAWFMAPLWSLAKGELVQVVGWAMTDMAR